MSKKLKWIFLFNLLILLFSTTGCRASLMNSKRNEELTKELDNLSQEAIDYSEDLKLLMENNSQILDSIKLAIPPLPDDEIWIYWKDDNYEPISTVQNISETKPEFLDYIKQIQELGMEWSELRIFPMDKAAVFTMVQKVEGNTSLYVSMRTPPLEISSIPFRRDTIEVSDNWGIYWSVNAMNGM